MSSFSRSRLCWLFFFKQKTAYEMRISDWSSDVCSSDLDENLHVGEQYLAALEMVEQAARRRDQHVDPAIEPLLLLGKGDAADQERHGEIGRASCRERVCQYV